MHFKAGNPSHEFGNHEQMGGSTLLAETIGEAGDKFLEWQGGYFETDWSIKEMRNVVNNRTPDLPLTLVLPSTE